MAKRQLLSQLLLLAVCIGLPTEWSVEAAPGSASSNSHVATCNTPYCAKAAKAILQDLRTSADPCVDFSQFACGGYYDRVKLKTGEQLVSYLTGIADQNEDTMRSFLVSNWKNDRMLTKGDPAAARVLKKVQSFYGACINERRLERFGAEPLRAVLDKMTRMLMPPAGTTQHTNETKKIALSTLLGYNMRHGLENPFTFELWDNSNLPGYRIMALQPAGKGLSEDDFYKDNELLRMYTRVIGRMLYMIEGEEEEEEEHNGKGNGGRRPRRPPTSTTNIPERWMKLASDVVDFERVLAGVQTSTDKSVTEDEQAPPKADLHNKTAQALDRQQRRRRQLTRRQDDGGDDGGDDDGEEGEVPDDDYIEWDTIDDLNEVMPSLDWHLIFKTAFPSDVPIPKEINMLWSFYLARINRAFTESPMETIRNYFAWTMIRTLGKNLSEDYRRPLIALEQFLPTTTKKDINRQQNRQLVCLDLVNEFIGQMAGHFFVKSIFPEAAQTQVRSIVTEVRRSFEQDLGQYDWLDETTRKNAIHKLQSIIDKVGYSHDHPNVGSSKAIEQWYASYAIHKADHFGNVLRGRQWRAEQFLREVPRKVNRLSMHQLPQTVNAFYNPTGNSIEIMTGILRDPFFHPDAPDYLNFAGVGTVIAHEIGHGFDNNGRRYDENGIIRDWWTEESVTNFDEKAQCFMDQYGNFTVKGPDGKDHHLNTWNTQGENIADNGGMKLAFNTWRQRLNSQSLSSRQNNRKLPGLERFSLEQLYFIQYARAFCAKSTPEHSVRMLNDDNHAPHKFRINGVLQNSEDFARAFQCKPGSPMNPVNKCVLW
ncbi:hypothetical protein BGW42_005769 [Actinomortierella wolfii]|nr:hypothetical protein BGW42_005769 [Actinomortierella wolfii]